METNGKRTVRETKRCDVCQRDIDIRGMRAHLEKHERESGKQPQTVGMRLVVPSDDPVVKAFRAGYELGKRVA